MPWTEAEARAVLAELRASGEPIVHFARKRGYFASRLHKWMTRLGERPGKKKSSGQATLKATPRPRFVSVNVAPPRPAARGGVAVEVERHLVHVERGFDPDVLRAVVAALDVPEARSC